MDGHRVDLKIPMAVRRVISHAKAMMFDLSNSEIQIQLGPHQMLKHRPHIIGAAGIRLERLGLIHQILNICRN